MPSQTPSAAARRLLRQKRLLRNPDQTPARSACRRSGKPPTWSWTTLGVSVCPSPADTEVNASHMTDVRGVGGHRPHSSDHRPATHDAPPHTYAEPLAATVPRRGEPPHQRHNIPRPRGRAVARRGTPASSEQTVTTWSLRIDRRWMFAYRPWGQSGSGSYSGIDSSSRFRSGVGRARRGLRRRCRGPRRWRRLALGMCRCRRCLDLPGSRPVDPECLARRAGAVQPALAGHVTGDAELCLLALRGQAGGFSANCGASSPISCQLALYAT